MLLFRISENVCMPTGSLFSCLFSMSFVLLLAKLILFYELCKFLSFYINYLSFIMMVKFVLSVLHFIRFFPAVRRKQLAGWRENHYLCLIN